MIRTIAKVDNIIFERIIFNLVRKLDMTINAVGSTELGRKNTDKTGLLRRECRLLDVKKSIGNFMTITMIMIWLL